MADDVAKKSPAELLVDQLEGVQKSMTAVAEKVDALGSKQDAIEKQFEDLKKPIAKRFGTRTGEDPLTSRPYSLMRLCMATRQPERYRNYAKVELGLAERLLKIMAPMGYVSEGGMPCPFSTYHMPTTETVLDNGEAIPGFPVELVKECGDLMRGSYAPDRDEILYLEKSTGVVLRKDLSAIVDTSGGTLVGLPAQGQLIDLLRPLEVFSRVGATEITLPPQGSIRFPRDTADPTIAGFGEGATITESTPTTGELVLSAKKYAGLVDIPVELFKFATSVSVEAWLRQKFVRRIAIQTDADMIAGGGGTKIQGVVSYSGFRTVVATTTAANGDTLEANDPALLYADIAEQNARVTNGFFYAFRPNLWVRLTHRRADAVSAGDKAGRYMFEWDRVGGDPIPDRLEGFPVVVSTNVPADRVKGTGTTLTLVLAGVGPSWIIGRAGVVEIDMTNSDGSKFGQGLNTMRGLVFMDAGPEQEAEFGMIDDLLATT